jgi:hypothetical protein
VPDGGALANWLINTSFKTPAYKEVPSMIAELAAGDAERIASSRFEQVTPPDSSATG